MFFPIVLAIYALTNAYLIHRGWSALAGMDVFRVAVLVIYLALSVCLFLGHGLNKGSHPEIKETLSALGSLYLGLLLYFVLFTALIDVLRAADHFFPFFPQWIGDHRREAGRLAVLAVTGLTSILLLAGYVHSRHVRIKKLEIAIDKNGGGLDGLNAVFFSDVHVGPFMRVSRVKEIVKTINGLNPDIILIGGDVIEEETTPLELERLPSALGMLHARYGVYACTGNHEYFAGIAKSLDMLEKSRITVLQDRTVLVDSSFYLAGRSNKSYLGNKERRMSLKEILQGADMTRPIIFLDHQPIRLDEAAESGVDLQLSGHTHAGQVFPISWINDRLFEIGWGYGRKMNTQYYVTSGVGVWAPPARIGTDSEIVLIKIRFRSK
jgi:predicted MPP superfamily phosphohydrolase